jgi:hypothetical protein
MDLALCLAVVFAGAALLRDFSPRLQIPAAAVMVLLAGFQLPLVTRYAKVLIRSVDITQSAAYRVAHWADQHMDGQRIMVSGSYSFHFTLFTDTPQLHGGHDPMQPNPVMSIAVFVIYSGLNAGERDAAISTLWLKAMGAHAISVPGPRI